MVEVNDRVRKWMDEYIKMVREGNQLLRILSAIERELLNEGMKQSRGNRY